MSKHTPGPWQVYTEDEYDADGRWAFTYVAGVNGGPDNEIIFRFDDDYGPQMSANARLIAAAPTMYNALKSLLAYFTPEHLDSVSGMPIGTAAAKAVALAEEGE